MTARGKWTPKIDSALNFESGVEAVEYFEKNKIKDAEIFYKFDHPGSDFSADITSKKDKLHRRATRR